MKAPSVQWICILLIPWLFACRNKTNSGQLTPEKHKEAAVKPPASYSDSIIIKNPSAVFFNTDSIQLEKIKAITDPAVFESMQHDCFYQMRNARNVINMSYPRIRIIEISKVRWVIFTTSKGVKEFVDLDRVNDPCGIFLFDGLKSSRLADMTNIDTELGQYFSR